MLGRDAWARRSARRLGIGAALLRLGNFYTMGPRGAITVAAARRRAVPSILSSAPIAVREDGQPEVHMLLQSSRIREGMCALYSLVHRIAGSCHVVVHDDGSFKPQDIEVLGRVFPGIRVITRAESDTATSRYFARYSLSRCARLRASFPLALKLFDVTLFARDDSFILLDSDVLFFSMPVSLLGPAGHDAGTPALPRYGVDVAEAYALPRSDMENILGCTPLARVNSGLLRTPRVSFERIESYLAHPGFWPDGPHGFLHAPGWYVEQTLYAMELTMADARPLSPEYAIAPRDVDSPDLISGHFCGGPDNQILYYRRALPRVAAELHQALTGPAAATSER